MSVQPWMVFPFLPTKQAFEETVLTRLTLYMPYILRELLVTLGGTWKRDYVQERKLVWHFFPPISAIKFFNLHVPLPALTFFSPNLPGVLRLKRPRAQPLSVVTSSVCHRDSFLSERSVQPSSAPSLKAYTCISKRP